MLTLAIDKRGSKRSTEMHSVKGLITGAGARLDLGEVCVTQYDNFENSS